MKVGFDIFKEWRREDGFDVFEFACMDHFGLDHRGVKLGDVREGDDFGGGY